MTLLLLAPFVVLAIYAIMHAGGFSGKAATPLRHVDFLAGLLVAMWNYMGWDNSTTIAEEVDRPQRTYPWAMAIGVILVALTYVLPIRAVALTGAIRIDGLQAVGLTLRVLREATPIWR